MIETKGIFIADDGDPDAGIFERVYSLKGDLCFENEEDFKNFKICLKAAFVYLGHDSINITTYEQGEKITRMILNSEEN